MMKDSSEPFAIRSDIATRLGLLKWDLGERGEAMELYYKALRYASRADADERQQKVVLHHPMLGVVEQPAGMFLDQIVIMTKLYIQKAEGQEGIGYRDLNENSNNVAMSHVMENMQGRPTSALESMRRAGLPDTKEPTVPGVNAERLSVGGDKCDGCKKTLEELGVSRLLICQRCLRAYYCSKACQLKSWKGGHKTACRKSDQMDQGDYMRLKGFKNQEYNGVVVQVVGPLAAERWQVELHGKNKGISVAAKNLEHLRPEK